MTSADAYDTNNVLTPEHDLITATGAADLVITCTARYVMTPADFGDVRPRLVIDLGLPRNVDPAVGALAGVELLDLELIGRHASLAELGAGAHELVGTAAATFHAERAAAPAIVALRAHVQAVLDAELARLGASDDRAATAL